tara:strand:+ start:1203 stop:1685 length:483 start_codon:yes stop_codon:yes gene_type:complete
MVTCVRRGDGRVSMRHETAGVCMGHTRAWGEGVACSLRHPGRTREGHKRLLLEVDVRLLHLLHQPGDVALAEHARDERLDLEVLEVLDVLARADVDDRRAGRRDRRERAAALGVAVELGDDARADGDLRLEGGRLLVRRLPDRRVHDEDDVVRLHRQRDL